MGIISYVKEEIQVIRERDPAIKSNMEVFLYPSFQAILRYRVAHKLYRKNIIFWQDGYLSGLQGKQGSRSIRVRRSGRACSSTMAAE